MRGFTLIETLAAVSIFIIVSTGIFLAFSQMTKLVRLSRIKVTIAALGNEQMEIIRNLPYDSVGIVGGQIAGTVPGNTTLTRDGFDFEVTTTIQTVDDPFDGVSPTDAVPNDYKLVEVGIVCLRCSVPLQSTFTTYVAPRAAEVL